MTFGKNLQIKFSFVLFSLLVAITFMGAASAALQYNDYMIQTGPTVAESGAMFNGPTALQDAVDHVETADGYHIQVEPGAINEQVTVRKDLTITGTSGNPDDTVIQSESMDGTVIIPEGQSVVFENLKILNINTYPIVNNGQLTLINCYVNDVYYANELLTVGGASGAPESTTTNTETMAYSAPLMATSPETATTAETPVITSEGTGTTTETSGTGTTSTPETSDPGIPLGSLASGMLMVMGGTVVSKRE